MTTKEARKMANLEQICNKSLWMSLQFAIFALAIAFIYPTITKFIAYCTISVLWYTTAIYAAKKRKCLTKDNLLQK